MYKWILLGVGAVSKEIVEIMIYEYSLVSFMKKCVQLIECKINFKEFFYTALKYAMETDFADDSNKGLQFC